YTVRLDVPSYAGRLAQADPALGAIFPRARGPERGDLAHAVDRLLGQLQAVRLRADHFCICGPAISAVDAVRGRTGAGGGIAARGFSINRLSWTQECRIAHI